MNTLFNLNQVELLSNLFDEIIIPTSVYDEVSVKKAIELPSFISIQKPKECELLKTLKLLLDLG